MLLRIFTVLCLIMLPSSAYARNIVLTNDDGLTSNVHALYHALKKAGHDVIVAVPCTGQSGMGAAIKFMRPLGPLRENCLNDVAKAGDPGAGAMTRTGFEYDFYYVDGTPIMSLLYGLDVVAMKRWGKAPDLVLSGPNEGQNVGYIVLSSGTVSNVQFASTRGIPAIALSAGDNTSDNKQLANPNSAIVAARSVELVQMLDKQAKAGLMLPPGILLNVNFPDELAGAKWKPSRIGTYNLIQISFTDDMGKSAPPEMVEAMKARGVTFPNLPGVTFAMNSETPRADQMDDEAVVYRKDIAVSVMQLAYDHQPSQRAWLREHLAGFLD